jgi:glycosyltransferase involved in cell wall biosynthesis
MTPSCTVVICTRDRPELLDRCLAAVANLKYPNQIDVLVVDNAPTNRRTYEVAMRRSVRYVTEPIPGQSRARNTGARESTGEVVAYLDDDSIPQQQWLFCLAKEFADPNVMAVTGRAVLPKAESEAERLLARMSSFDAGPVRRIVDRDTEGWFEIANFGIGIGANMALRREAFAIWPGFEVRLGRGTMMRVAEDGYAFFSLIDRGYRVAYTPDAVVHHPCLVKVPSIDEIRARCLDDLAAATAYMVFLFAEQPRYRRATAGFLAKRLVGVHPSWRTLGAEVRDPFSFRWKKKLSRLRGALLFLRFRYSHGRRVTQGFSANSRL